MDELQGHRAAEANVLGTVDDAHAACAQLADDPVVGNRPSKHEARATEEEGFS
jgi:hypothetical protein